MLFNIEDINPTLWTLNDFTSKVLDLRTKGKEKLLVLYMTLLVKSSAFYCNVDTVHDEDGFRFDKQGVQFEDVEKETGSTGSL